MDEATALALLTAQCAAATYPTLTQAQLSTILLATQRFVLWTASTPFVYDDVVRPTVRNGHLYRCTVAGTTSTVEPFWPTYTSPDDRAGLTRPFWHGFVGPMPGSQIGDGSVVWIEHGPDGEQWDVRLATYNAWMQKYGLASADYDATKDRNVYNRSQVLDHCERMMRRYAPTGIV